MRILLTGASGLIGSNLHPSLKAENPVFAPTRGELDISSIDSVRNYFEKVKPEVVINCAGAVGTLEGEKERWNLEGSYWKTNVVGVENILNNLGKFKSYLIQISSEIVFSGTFGNPGPYEEDAEYDGNTAPLSWYGFTKREAEKLIRKKYPNAAIVRLCRTVGSKNLARPDYLQKILKDFDLNGLEPQFTDQYLGLTDFDDVVKVLERLIEQKLAGIFHVASDDQLTPFEISKYLLFRVRGVKEVVNAVSIADYLKKIPHTYIQFGGLKSTKTQKKINVQFASAVVIIDSKIPFLKSA